jgi:hypothetical protein
MLRRVPRGRLAARRIARAAPRVLAALCVTVTAIPGARADLEDDAARLATRWQRGGAAVTRLDALFLEHGRARTVIIPDEPRGPSASPTKGCLSIAFVAVRTADLTIDVGEATRPSEAERAEAPAPRGPERSASGRTRSAGGVVAITRCGAARAELQRVHVEIASSRAAVEIVIARSTAPPDAIPEALPERVAGPMAPRGESIGPIEPGPLPDRLARAERRARDDGAARVTRASMRASAAGNGEFDVSLVAGCHRLELMAEIPTTIPRRATDIDAEARTEDGHVLARDRAEVPDARLDLCVGETTRVEVPFIGASGAVTVTLSDARWPVPALVPSAFGARAQSGMFGALLLRRAPLPDRPPVRATLGVQGASQMAIEVEPGRCYLAALGVVRGEARFVRLSARLGDRVARDETQGGDGAAIAFCAEDEATAILDVDARGNAPWWALELWPVGGAAP